MKGGGFGRKPAKASADGARAGRPPVPRQTRQARQAARPAEPLTEERLRGWVTVYVSRYGTTTDHLRKHVLHKVDLLRRALPEDDTAFPGPAAISGWLDAAIGSAVSAGLVNDSAWAESRTRRLLGRGVSPSSVRQRLGGKGIEREAAGVALASIAAETGKDPTLSSARALVRRRRLGPWRADASARRTERQKDLGKLGRAGFPYEVARRVLDETMEEACGEVSDEDEEPDFGEEEG